MTTITKGNAVFSVDLDATRAYYTTHSLCECGCCRNLYAQIKTRYPQLEEFLSAFGADICRPDEAAGVEMEDHIDYLFVGYTVTGALETKGPYETDIGSLHVTISRGDTPWDTFPHQQTKPCFFVSVSGISLPQVLPEPFPG